MLGFGFREHGGIDRLEFVEVPVPEPGPGEIRIHVRSAAFNRLDRFTLAGIPGVAIVRPHVLGSDASGVVDALGAGVDGPPIGAGVLLNPGLSDGDCEACRRGAEQYCRSFRILGEHTQGSAAPYVVVPARNVYPKPERLSFTEAAAAPLVFQTAWRALLTVGELAPGERVAIVGAGGGVATAAVQIAKMRGAIVAVASRSRAKAERTLALGADAALEFGEERPLDRVLWEWSGKRGVDVIFDSVGAPTVPRSVQATARGGRVVIIGATTDPMVRFDLRTLFWRQASLRGSTMSSRAEFGAMLEALAKGPMRPIVDTSFPFEKAHEAFMRFESPDLFGKIVVGLSDA